MPHWVLVPATVATTLALSVTATSTASAHRQYLQQTAAIHRRLSSHLASVSPSEHVGSSRQVSPTFAGSCNLYSPSSSGAGYVLQQYLVYDEDREVQAVQTLEALPFGNQSHAFDVSTYLYADGANLTINGRCQPLAGDKFAHQYTWLDVATSHGNITVDGRQCELLTYDNPGLNISLSLCLGTNNVPVQSNVSTAQYVTNGWCCFF